MNAPRVLLSCAAACMAAALFACVPPPERADDHRQADASASSEVSPAEEGDIPPPPPAALRPRKPAGPLTAEEERLIAADPSTLSREENRARAYALRKRIMQDPNSPAAKELEEARAAVLAGEVDAALPKDAEKADQKSKHDSGLVLQAPL
ncbi:hypothetical protein G6O69_38160 [Pseudenhygromyxa sp. WMMC2535]|uniref:hypothetical protein n=1 Tax=Pseudenhygromyxa sp. WMMC2535 TaxID=2712867 RepID=UPI0015583478|nr:hypothetical protein [Pseudenhygromyxa sp. WMMC2535]NVB41382.1 hypothetical protein [Pseudenhygromyxa sp. WMMC2535]NVB43692.1 hypothetical protein [Pseudenhygromyxa sp. WMMC2535]